VHSPIGARKALREVTLSLRKKGNSEKEKKKQKQGPAKLSSVGWAKLKGFCNSNQCGKSKGNLGEGVGRTRTSGERPRGIS